MAESTAALGAGARVGPDLRRSTPRGLGLRLATWVRHPWLDRDIARGAARPGDRRLALREAQLVAPGERARLARRFEEVLAARPLERGLSSSIPIDTRAVQVARPVLAELIAGLRSAETVEPRGVVLARRLLTDATSPLYGQSSAPEGADRLWYESLSVLFALRPLSASASTGP